MSNIFEKASRLRLRFATDRGNLSVEDLWQFPLETLDVMAVNLEEKLGTEKRKTFLNTPSKDNSEIKLKFDIVLHILNTKKEELEARTKDSERKKEKERLLELLEAKLHEEDANLSPEELRKKIEALD